MPYSLLEHTADVGLEVEAASLPELFSDAVRGMSDVITDVERVEAIEEQPIEARAEWLDVLLLEFLSEALYRFEVKGEIFAGARVEVDQTPDGWSLSGVVAGEPFDPIRHTTRVMIKAVTYHQLALEQSDSGWRGRVIFDI